MCNLVNEVKKIINILKNLSLKRGIFADELQIGEVIPLFKKIVLLDKTEWRPVRLLFHISKVFEEIIYNQTNQIHRTFPI